MRVSEVHQVVQVRNMPPVFYKSRMNSASTLFTNVRGHTFTYFTYYIRNYVSTYLATCLEYIDSTTQYYSTIEYYFTAYF